MTEEQSDQFAGLLFDCLKATTDDESVHCGILLKNYVERLELEAQLDEHETYCEYCGHNKDTCKRRKKLLDQIKEKGEVTV